MDKPINLHTVIYTNVLPDAPAMNQQETVWRGERCVVYMPASSLLSGGSEEISFSLSEYAEQNKLRQEKQRLLILLLRRKKKNESIDKVKARQDINDQLRKDRENNFDDSV